jgi:hypothetical protein
VEYLDSLGLTCGARVGHVAILLEHPAKATGERTPPSNLLTAGLAQRSTHFMKIIYVEDSRVLLGVFKHQHLNFCKRDLRTPARVIM